LPVARQPASSKEDASLIETIILAFGKHQNSSLKCSCVASVDLEAHLKFTLVHVDVGDAWLHAGQLCC
jgi:hypothetical protein